MLCRTSELIHPSSDMPLRTPLLVPSFSSKVFGFSYDGQSEILHIVDVFGEFITRTCLISAYDIYYEYIPAPEDLGVTVDLIFVDSGGYEVSGDCDLSAVDRPVHGPKDWDIDKLDTIASRWPEAIPAVFVSYDHPDERHSVPEQLRRAKNFSYRHPGHLYLFLLKPQSQHERTLESALEALSRRIEYLAGFQLLGLTEKELGSSVLERMIRIARLRQALDAFGLSIPIHVFGALTPLSVALYFVAGAEVFDGLTWIRYAYNGGICTYIQDSATLNYGVEIQEDVLRVRTVVDNLRCLEHLERCLRRFGETKNWDELITHKDIVQQTARRLHSELRRME